MSQTSQPPAGTKSSRPPGSERRTSPRLALAVQVGLRSESNFYTGFTGDISEGGLFIATYNLLPIGSRLTVSFGLPGGHELSIEAEVRWVHDPIDDHNMDPHARPGMGVRFVSLSEHDAEAIHQFMEHRPPLFYDDEDV